MRRLTLIVAMSGAVGCASAPPPAPADPGPPFDRRQAVLSLVRRTAITAPTQIRIEWDGREIGGAHVSGTGVVRIEPPAKARLDLFTSNLEAVVVVALEGEELRFPPGSDSELTPSVDLLWALLGVFHQGRDLTVVDANRTPDGEVVLRVLRAGGGEFRIHSADGRLLRMERLVGGDVVERVELEPGVTGRFPATALYRHLSDLRELRITLISEVEVEQFPPDIWHPGG